jgi:hypothetical protein
MHGLGNIIQFQACPPDRIVDLFSQIPVPEGVFQNEVPCCCGGSGMGALTMDGTGLFGSGLFADPFNVSTWGFGEYAVLGLAAYMLYAVVSTTKHETRRVSRGYRRLKARVVH